MARRTLFVHLPNPACQSFLYVSTGRRRRRGLWGHFQERIAGDDELQELFGTGAGVGVVGGSVSGNLEIFDIEEGAPVKEFAALVKDHDPRIAGLSHVSSKRRPAGTPSRATRQQNRGQELVAIKAGSM